VRQKRIRIGWFFSQFRKNVNNLLKYEEDKSQIKNRKSKENNKIKTSKEYNLEFSCWDFLWILVFGFGY